MATNVDWMEGFEPLEAGNLSTVGVGYGYTGSSGSGTQINSSDARNGSKCLRISNGSSNYQRFLLSGGTNRGVGCAVKYTGTPAYFEPIVGFFDGSDWYGVGINTAGVLCVFDGNSVQDTGTVPLTASVYYYVEFSFNTATGAYTARLNESDDVLTGTMSTAGTISSIQFGYHTNVGGVGTVRFVDDAYSTSDGSLLGDRTVDYRFPTADGSNQDWTPATGGDGFDMIDNVPVDAADYVEASTAADVSDFDFGAMGVTAYEVEAVMLIANWLRTGATSETARTRVNIGGSNYPGATVTVPQTTATWARQIWDENPDTSVDWVPADVQSSFDAGLERVS